MKFSLATLTVMAVLMAIVFRTSWRDNEMFARVLLVFCALVFLSLSVVIVMKRLWPALNGSVALQVDEEGISDFVKDISIEWKYVKDIQLIRGTSASIMRIDLNWETDHGSQIAIYLRWVRGRDGEIYQNTRTYFEHYAAGQNKNEQSSDAG